MSGVEGYEPETMGPKADIAARQMQLLDKNMSNVVDKKMGMQPVKGIEKPKKDSDKGGETNKAEKGISLMSLIAKSTRGVQKMNATGEKMKKIALKEISFNDMGEPNKVSSIAMDFINSNPTLNKISNELTIQNSHNDAILQYRYWNELPDIMLAKLEMKFDVEVMKDFDEDTGNIIAYRLISNPKKTGSMGSVDLGGSFNKFKDQLKEMIRKEQIVELSEAFLKDSANYLIDNFN
jgi:hypothetical protein